MEKLSRHEGPKKDADDGVLEAEMKLISVVEVSQRRMLNVFNGLRPSQLHGDFELVVQLFKDALHALRPT